MARHFATDVSVTVLEANEQDPIAYSLANSLKPEARECSALDALEAEMKLLHWHKLSNDAALKVNHNVPGCWHRLTNVEIGCTYQNKEHSRKRKERF